MKRYHDMTDAELVDLNGEQIDRIIEVEVAFAGVEPVMCPEAPKLEDLGITKTVEVFVVAGLLFANREDAEAVARLPVLKEDYDYKIGYGWKYLSPLTELSIKGESYYTEDDLTRVQSAILHRDKLKENYKKEKESWDGFTASIAEIKQGVWNAIGAARTRVAELRHALEIYSHHLDLADNDEEVAKKFFRDAFKGRPSLIKAVLGEDPVEEEDHGTMVVEVGATGDEES